MDSVEEGGRPILLIQSQVENMAEQNRDLTQATGRKVSVYSFMVKLILISD